MPKHQSANRGAKQPRTPKYGGDNIKAKNLAKIGNMYGGKIIVGGEEKQKIPVEKDWKEFFDKVHSRAEEACPIQQVLNQVVTVAPLQITERAQHQYDDDEMMNHHHRRSEISAMISKPPKGDVSYKKLFDEASKRAQEQADELVNDTEEAKQTFSTVHGNIVGVIGQAGIGKTTLTKVILKDIRATANKKNSLYGSKYVFYLTFRNINYDKETNFLKFLSPSIECSWINDSNDIDDKHRRDAVLERIAESENICIILDGFDEANINWNSGLERDLNIYDVAKAEHFIANLLRGKILPKAKKLITSRPRQLNALKKVFRPHFIVKILGLDEAAQKQICKDVCKESGNHVKVFDYIQNNPDLSSYCFVPVICILAMYCVNLNMSEKQQKDVPPPTSMTMIMTAVLVRFKKAHHKEEKPLPTKKLAHLAWNGFSNKQLSFYEDDLKKCKLDEVNLNTLLITINGENKLPFLHGDICSITYFSHLLIQEYFSALYLILHMDTNHFSSLFFEYISDQAHFDLNESRFEMVVKFMFGLCNRTTVEYLNHGIASCSYPDEKSSKLKMFLRNNLVKFIESSPSSFENFLRICNLVYEMKDDEVAAEVAESLPNQLEVERDILPSDIGCVGYVLQKRKKLLLLDVRAEFIGNIFTRFLKLINAIPFVQMSRLELSNNKIDDEGVKNLSHALKNICWLTLQDCEITAQVFKTMASEIKQLKNPMENFILVSNPIDDEGAKNFSPALKKIRSLDLQECDITAQGWKIMATEIEQLDKPMETLELSKSKIDDERAKYLSPALKNICSLSLYKCDITAQGFKEIATEINQLKKPMEKLELSNNEIDDEGAENLSPALKNIQKLSLEDCDVTAQVFKTLATEIKQLENPMETLVLSENEIDNEGAKNLSPALQNIRNLTLQDCEITAQVFKTLATKIKQLENPMEKLELSNNEIDNEGAKNLSPALKNIRNLTLEGCDFTTAQVFKTLATEIKELENPMEKLALSNIEIDEKGAKNLSPALMKIQWLSLEDCDITAQVFKTLATEIKELENPMETLELRNEIDDEGAKNLSPALKNIRKLTLEECNITAQGLNIIAGGIKQLKNPMEKLELTRNRLDKEGAKNLSPALKNIRKLTLCGCGITAPVLKTLATEIKKLENPMEALELSNNGIDDEGAKNLSPALDKICKLSLESCDVTLQVFKTMATEIKQLKNPMEKLELSLMKIDKEVATDLSPALKNICTLSLRNCDLSTEVLKTLATGIKELENSMEKLELNSNKLDDEGAKILSPALKNIRKLTLDYCDITPQGLKTLATEIKQLKKPMETLNLSNNKINGERAKNLSPALENIRNLNLESCDITAQIFTTMASEIKELKNPITSLDLRFNKIGDAGFKAILLCLRNIKALCIGDELDQTLSMDGIKSLALGLQNLATPMKSLKVLCPRSIVKEARVYLKKYSDKVEDGPKVFSSPFDLVRSDEMSNHPCSSSSAAGEDEEPQLLTKSQSNNSSKTTNQDLASSGASPSKKTRIKSRSKMPASPGASPSVKTRRMPRLKRDLQSSAGASSSVKTGSKSRTKRERPVSPGVSPSVKTKRISRRPTK